MAILVDNTFPTYHQAKIRFLSFPKTYISAVNRPPIESLVDKLQIETHMK